MKLKPTLRKPKLISAYVIVISLVALRFAWGEGQRAELKSLDLDNKPTAIAINNADENRPDDQYTTQLFGHELVIGGEYEIRAEHRDNYALSDTNNDRELFKQKLELEFSYTVGEHISALAETKFIAEHDHRTDRNEHFKSVERGQTWLDIHTARPKDDGNWGLRIGRQNLNDKREWWWDENLDAIRLYYASSKLNYELAFAEELGGKANNQPLPARDKDIQRLFGRVKWEYAKGHKLGFFLLDHNDESDTPNIGDTLNADEEDKSDKQLTWYGIRARGKDKIKGLGKLRYWMDLAAVRGDETSIDFDDLDDNRIEVDSVSQQKVSGTAIDLGVTLKTKLAGRPSFTLGFAQGSGDDNPNDGINHAFQQTGLQDNNDKFNGVDSFRYYGELLRPELSNLRISTASIGYPLLKDSSIEVLYHRYDQVEPSTTLNSRLRIKPNGTESHIGDEIDIVLGLEEWKHIELELVGSVFRAGDAFGDREGDMSSFIGGKFNYNF